MDRDAGSHDGAIVIFAQAEKRRRMRASEIAVGPWVSAVWPATALARGNRTKMKTPG